MVPGDIYIGKATLIQYEIKPVFAGDYDGPDDVVVECIRCGKEVVRFDDYYLGWKKDFVKKNPWDVLKSILEHEKECPEKCKKDVSPAEDSSMTNVKNQEVKDAAVATKEVKDSSQSKGNPYANIEKNGGALTMTVVPKNNVL